MTNQFKRRRLVMVAAILFCTSIAVQILSVRSTAAVVHANAFMTISVTNNATRDVRHLYVTPTDHDAWGPDLLGDRPALRTGESFAITDVTCSTNEIKVIAEDGEGCFVYGVVSCAQASTSWTITNDAPRDCGN